MEIDNEKVDEMTLALLYLTTFKDKYGLRAGKTHSWDALDRLHESGNIHEPATKAKSVMLTAPRPPGNLSLVSSTKRKLVANGFAL